jgi:hypothetical protein
MDHTLRPNVAAYSVLSSPVILTSSTGCRAGHARPAPNGSLDPSGYRVKATDTVTVNGNDAGTVTFPHTAWGNWQQIDYSVKLVSGWNSITFTTKTFFTELDAIDLS